MSFTSTMQFVWPVLVSAAAWGIAIWALREPDAHSDIVKRLAGDWQDRQPLKHAKSQEGQPHSRTDGASYDNS